MSRQIINPVLTKVVQGYANGEMVGMRLFPEVNVPTAGGQVIEFDKTSWKVFQSARARGENTKRVNFGYKGAPYALENHSLEGSVPREDMRDTERTTPELKLGTRASKTAYTSLALGLEVQQAQKATDLNSYPTSNRTVLSGTSQFSNPNSDPFVVIENGREAVRSQCGKYPNEMVLSPPAYKALKNHPKVVERLKYSHGGKAITAEMLGGLFDIETVSVGTAIAYNDATDEFGDVWGNHIAMGYVPPKSDQAKEMPSFAYTYRMTGHPFVEVSYYDNNSKTHYFPVTDERIPVVSSIVAGYLIFNAAA